MIGRRKRKGRNRDSEAARIGRSDSGRTAWRIVERDRRGAGRGGARTACSNWSTSTRCLLVSVASSAAFPAVPLRPARGIFQPLSLLRRSKSTAARGILEFTRTGVLIDAVHHAREQRHHAAPQVRDQEARDIRGGSAVTHRWVSPFTSFLPDTCLVHNFATVRYGSFKRRTEQVVAL